MSLKRRTAMVLTLLSLAVISISAPATAIPPSQDPAYPQTPYSDKFVLFRSANMSNPDKLSSGVGFHSFRIPAVVKTSTGRMLAFAEGRRCNRNDWGDINLVYKMTKTPGNWGSASEWSGLREVAGAGNGTWGNPTPVVDGNTIYLFMSSNGGNYSQHGNDPKCGGGVTAKIDATEAGRRRLWLTKSTDDGYTWSAPVDMTRDLTPDGWGWDAVGPAVGIRIGSGDGNLVVPAKGRNIIGYGPSGNRSWYKQMLPGAGTEGTIAQTPDGNLYRNDRPDSGDYRWVARGTLGGFGGFSSDGGLPDPGCEGSVLTYNTSSPTRMIFMNSGDKSSRLAMRVRISYDANAGAWNYGRKLSDDPISGAGYEGGYSSMVKTPDNKIGALVESDFHGTESYRAIIWRRFNLSWILHSPNM